MASVYLLSAAPGGPGNEKAHLDLKQMRDSARADRFGTHRVVDDPAAADLILFVETSWGAGYYFEQVRKHPVYREFRPKCFLFSAMDRVVPLLPGVFASIERRWCWRAWARSGFYPGVREGGPFRYEPDGSSPPLLFSFIGAANAHPVRRGVLALQHPRALLLDTEAEAGSLSEEEYQRRYVDSVRDSAFVLCPRGGGTTTFRLFEAMMLGRAPVIVSDEWVPPEGPAWDNFGIRISEDEVGAIPALLEARADRAAEMGRAARGAWLDWFSEAAAFHRTVEWCLDLQRRGPDRAGIKRYAPRLQMLRPYHAARKVAKGLGHGEAADI